MLKHGGNRLTASQDYGIPLADWLDLSTGINPNGWPVPALDPECWQRLPERHDGLEQAAKDYYQAAHLLPVAGSQAAIQVLPQLRPESVVATIEPAYAEHAHAWQQAGHQLSTISTLDIELILPRLDVLVVVNPNNPTGHRFESEVLLRWHRQLSQRGGWLIVDEAFMDSTPEYSLAAYSDRPGLIVLRSLGKFFGLAGARCGFVLAEEELLQRIEDVLGPWTVTGPGRAVARQALADHNWQHITRTLLQVQGQRLYELLAEYSLTPTGGTSLFQWLPHQAAWRIHTALARQGILTRYFNEPGSIRFGLPGTEADWQRLAEALATTMQGELKEFTDETS